MRWNQAPLRVLSGFIAAFIRVKRSVKSVSRGFSRVSLNVILWRLIFHAGRTSRQVCVRKTSARNHDRGLPRRTIARLVERMLKLKTAGLVGIVRGAGGKSPLGITALYFQSGSGENLARIITRGAYARAHERTALPSLSPPSVRHYCRFGRHV